MKKLLTVWICGLLLCSAGMAQELIQPFMRRLPPPVLQAGTTNSEAMQIQKMQIDARANDWLATVDTTLTFYNPNDQILEGSLTFPLPDGAAVCGYALDINGQLVDGVAVPKEKARVAFETETRVRVDPGLVEHVKGNVYRTRIYPLPAKGTRTIRLSYHTPLPMDERGRPVLFLPVPDEPIGELSVQIQVAVQTGAAPELGGLGDRRFEQAEQLWRVESGLLTNHPPGGDMWVALPVPPEHASALETAPDGDTWFWISTVAPPDAAGKRDAPADLYVAWDASGSRLRSDVEKEIRVLQGIAESASRIHLLVFRNVPETMQVFDNADALAAALRKVEYDGGTDFAALSAAMKRDAEWVLFTDGMDTLSGAAVEFDVARITPFISGVTADAEALRQACGGMLVDLRTLDDKQAVELFFNPPPRVTGLSGGGLADVQGIGRPAQGRVHLVGRLTAPETTVAIQYSTDGQSAPFVLKKENAVQGTLLARAWAVERIQQLSPRAEAYQDELLALGRRYGLVSPVTSLITLETLQQWIRHEIEPPESLPEMRKQWNDAMNSKAKQLQQDHDGYTRRLQSRWNSRVAWWTNTYPMAVKKNVPIVAGQRWNDGEAGEPGELVIASDALSPVIMRDLSSSDQSREFVGIAARSSAVDIDSLEMAEMVDRVTPPDVDINFGAAAPTPASRPAKSGSSESPCPSSIQIGAWNPDVPYLAELKNAAPGEAPAAYMKCREDYAASPSFYLDCAGFFLQKGEPALGIRILTNLAEMQIEDAGLLRVLAWRLRQAGDMETAIRIMRRVLLLRGEEPQSYRDLALLLTETGMAQKSVSALEEALQLYHTIIQKDWPRHGLDIGVFALEERNALAAWIERTEWPAAGAPAVPELLESLAQNLDTDIRIVLSWDADATDIDLHVVEPGGEEASYARNRTTSGGLVSTDIRDGYGPEEYLIRKAPDGTYDIQANYFGSNRQSIFGPATATVTLYTDWGRPEQKTDILTVRLDKVKERVPLGDITWGDAAGKTPVAKPADVSRLAIGMEKEEVAHLFGLEPDIPPPFNHIEENRTLTFEFDDEGRLVRVVETRPGNLTTILLQ